MLATISYLAPLFAEAAAETESFNPLNLVLPAAVIFMLYQFIVVGPKKREKEDRKKRESIKTNDKVVTIGGIHGVVLNVQKEKGTVVLRVDENGGAKMKFNLTAIASNASTEEKTDEKETKSSKEKET